jgi:hypothetical protein
MVPLTERDAWLKHYLGQSVGSGDLDHAMRFNDRPPTTVIAALLKQGVQIERAKVVTRYGRPVWVYPVKRLVAVVRAHGVTVTQHHPRHWVPSEVIAAEVRHARDGESLAHAAAMKLRQEIEDLKRQYATEIANARLHALRQVRDEYALRDMAPEDVTTLMGMMMTAHELRPTPGVYWLIDEAGSVVYVGQSKNCLSRMAGHRDKPFVSARMLAIEDDGRRSLVERMLIMSLTPAHNVKMIPGRRRAA